MRGAPSRIRTAIAPALAAVALLCASPAAATAAAIAPGDETYQRALDLYEHGEYATAATEFGKLLYPPPAGMDPEKLRRAHLYRGIALFLVDNKSEADSEFYQVLLFDPEYSPDPLFTPPAVIAAFQRLKREKAEELRKVRVTRRKEDPARDPLGIPLDPRANGSSDVREFWWSIAPFGAAQFHNKQPGKAYALLAIETPLLIANLSSAAAFESLQKEGSRFRRDEVDDARIAKTVNNVSFVLLVGTLLYGSADGLWYGSLSKPRTPAQPLLTPGPGSAGLMLTWEF